jgi:hypothetical protein
LSVGHLGDKFLLGGKLAEIRAEGMGCKGHFATPGEIELHGGGLIFVTTPQGGTLMRVDREVRHHRLRDRRAAHGNLFRMVRGVRAKGDTTERLYEHKPALPGDSGSIVVTLD